jgi:hypothetical protein
MIYRTARSDGVRSLRSLDHRLIASRPPGRKLRAPKRGSSAQERNQSRHYADDGRSQQAKENPETYDEQFQEKLESF